jgi:hypothetical protein
VRRTARLGRVDPWLRLLGLAAAAIAAVLLLKLIGDAAPIAVLVLFVGGVAYVNHALKGQVRREHRGADAETLGLRHERGDPFGLLGYPFALLGRGREGRVEDVAWGPWQGLEVRAFRFTYERPSVAGEPDSTHAFLCALAPVEASCPPLALEPRSFLTPPGERPPMASLETGIPALDERFDVRCDDAVFASTLLDEPMRAWIAGLGDLWGLEVSGRLALAYSPADGGRGTVDALPVVRGFLDRVPGALRSTADREALPERPDHEASG